MRLEFENYTAEIENDSIAVYLGNRRYTLMRVGTAVNGVDAKDIDEPLTQPDVECVGNTFDFIWQTKSNLWKQKTYHWHFENELFWCQVSVEGHNTLGELRYLDDGKLQSHYDFSRFFTSECVLMDQRVFHSMQYASDEAPFGGSLDGFMTIPSGGQMFIPPPFYYCLGFSSGDWLSVGLTPQKDQYNFSRFNYVSGMNNYWFRLTYDGMTTVNGKWTAPKLVFRPAQTPYDGLNSYCNSLREWGLVEENKSPRAEWWSRPMICGWGEQHILARRGGDKQPNSDFATQKVYDSFIRIIDEKRLKPGTITIDDKWQKEYGTAEVDPEKWPDLRGWVDARHAEDRKVVLWYGVSNPEGLPKEECILDANGNRKYPDPSNPAYLKRVQAIVHRMLSSDPGCYNADGIKLDWFYIPSASGCKCHGDIWGVEMFKQLVQTIYQAVKAAKPDALLITHTGNPYFAECTDMLRLNDITDRSREIVSMMTHRYKIAHAACPQALIDCDNSCAPTHTEWMEYMKYQPTLGVPSCYFLTAVDGTMEPITDEDWGELSSIWR